MAQPVSPWLLFPDNSQIPADQMGQGPLVSSLPPQMPQPPKVQATGPRPQRMPAQSEVVVPQMSPQQMLIASIQEGLAKREQEAAGYRERAGQVGENQMNLKPLVALADTWMGTRMADSYEDPNATREKVRQGLLQQAMKADETAANDRLAIAKMYGDEAYKDRRMDNLEQLTAFTGMKAMKAENKDGNNIEFKLRNEWDSDPVTKNTKTVLEGFEKIGGSLAGGSRASDLSLIYGLMKMQDPGSTVRESETEMAQTIGGFPEKTQAMWSSFMGTGRLTPEQRQAIVAEARAIRDAQLSRQAQVDAAFKDLATNYGARAENVVTNRMFAETKNGKATKPAGKITINKGTETLMIDEKDWPAAQLEGYRRVQ